MVPPAAPAAVPMAAPIADLPRVGVVVLNWNAAWFTRRCLRAVARTDYPSHLLRVVLADNGSVDGSLEDLTAWLQRPGAPRVEVLANGANLGFAEGCNRAIRQVLGTGPDRVDLVALVNNDAWPEPGWVREMVEVMADHPDCAAVSARLVLEPGFVPVDVSAGSHAVRLRSVRLRQGRGQGRGPALDVGDRVRTDGFTDEGALVWPARRIWQLAAGRTGRVWVPVGDGDGEIEVGLVDGTGTVRVDSRSVGADRVRLLNGVGTRLNESGEGYDIGYGEPDPYRGVPASQTSEVVDGFCGGAAMLRGAALDEVGLFDPAFFAYYEDTDLSWRMRNAGWEVRTAPAAVVHHAFGASGGGGSPLHVFLDRRNWLVSNLRNGNRTEIRRAMGWLRRGSWRLFRVNVFGRLRRGRSAQWQPLLTWTAATASALARLPRLHRRGRVGARPTDRVRSRLQPSGSPKAPAPRPGGPLVVYIDVGETLKAGYRAGIQRVVCALVAELPGSAPDVELVPIRWCGRNGAFRRITSAEWASLQRSGDAPPPAADTAAVAGTKQALRSGLGRLGVLAAVRGGRERIFGRRRRALEDSLVLAQFAPGAVLLEVDAVWNELEVHRDELLAELRGRGVHVAVFVHDLLPIEQPEWFAPHLREIFVPTALAQLRSSELLLCASAASRRSIEDVCTSRGFDTPPVCVVPLGTSGAPTSSGPTGPDGFVGDPGTDAALPPRLRDTRFLLVVGTLESRKNHALALEVFDALAGEFDDLHLVFAGRHGWGVDELVATLERHPLRNRRVHWLDDVHDDELEALYRSAFLVLVPSWSEGFGLPVVEALSRGTPVVASPGGALAESAAGAANYAEPTDAGAWMREVRAQLVDEERRRSAVAAAAGYELTPWDVSAAAVGDALTRAFLPVAGTTNGDLPRSSSCE